MSINIDQLFKMLSWNNDMNTQKKGIEMARSIKYISVLIQPIEDKSTWENCAKVLEEKSDDELQVYLTLLMEWLQDANWPGFDIIYERIKKMPAQLIHYSYSFSVKKAQELNDIEWLNYLSGMIDNKDLFDLLTLKQQNLLKKHYKKFWGNLNRK